MLSLNLASATGEANDLWFLLSTHEDAKLTLEVLAEFLTENGYNAKPNGSYLTVALSQDEEEVYLTPNGLIPGLADMWQTRPENIPAEPVLVEGFDFKRWTSRSSGMLRMLIVPSCPKRA